MILAFAFAGPKDKHQYQEPTTVTYAQTAPEIVYSDFSLTIRCDGTTAIYTNGNGVATVPNSEKCKGR